MTKLFPVQEIGSLAKPRWRTKGLSNPLSSQDLVDAEQWAVKLDIENYQDWAKDLLRVQDQKTRAKKLLEFSTIYGLRLFEKTGLDNEGVGGEQQRVEMYEHVVRAVEGMRPLGHVQSFDNKYFNKAVAESRISRKHPIYLQEFLDVAKNAKNPVKVPITGAYTMADWSFPGYYTNSRKGSSLKQRGLEGKREFLLDLVEQIIRPEIRDLLQAGARWIQIDEPAVTTHPEKPEMDLFVESWNETVRGFNCKFSDHTCYPSEIGYRVLSEYAPRLDKCSQLALEFANRDTSKLGTDDGSRIGYSDLKNFVENGYEGEYGVGVVHVHDFSGEVPPDSGKRLQRDIIESPELVRDRLLYATEIVGDPGKIWANPDCGLRTRTWDITYSKLAAVVEGSRLAREAFS